MSTTAAVSRSNNKFFSFQKSFVCRVNNRIENRKLFCWYPECVQQGYDERIHEKKGYKVEFDKYLQAFRKENWIEEKPPPERKSLGFSSAQKKKQKRKLMSNKNAWSPSDDNATANIKQEGSDKTETNDEKKENPSKPIFLPPKRSSEKKVCRVNECDAKLICDLTKKIKLRGSQLASPDPGVSAPL